MLGKRKSKASLSEAKTPQEVVLLKLGQIKYARVKSAAGHRASPSEPHEIAETQCFDSKIEKYSPAQMVGDWSIKMRPIDEASQLLSKSSYKMDQPTSK